MVYFVGPWLSRSRSTRPLGASLHPARLLAAARALTGISLLVAWMGLRGIAEPAGPFVLQVSPEFGVRLSWSDPTSELGYVVETRDSFSAAAPWRPAPATVWPSRSPTWTDAGLPKAPQRYYRAVAWPGAAERGKLLSVSEAGTLSPLEIRAGFAQLGLTLETSNGVRMAKLTYETVNPFGLRTLGSGLIVYPDVADHQARPLVSYQHGTIVEKEEAPSAAPGLDRLVGIALGATGYITAMADYVGLGESPGLHPYVHAKSEATAAIDLLRASRAFFASNSLSLNGQLFLIGYSEGGHATMALHKELETHHTNEFTVTASAPMAGPYDLSGTMVADFLSGREMGSPYYFLYLLAAYQSIYQFAPSLADLLASPYDKTLPPLLDGRHSGGELDEAMGTAVPTQILKPQFLAAFRDDPTHPFRLALKENDLYDWNPQAPIRLYHCAGDKDVVPANSKVAYETMIRNGVTQVALIDPLPSASHGTCAPIALFAAKLWFDSMVER